MEQTQIHLAPLISHDKEGCTRCWSCVRVCPVKAIRVVGDRWEVMPEKCVACGLCVAECGRGDHLVRDDTPVVRELLRSGRPVVALLASEFAAALHPMTVRQIERSLEALGFGGIETTVLGEEIVAEAYKNIHLREGCLVSIRSTCPVTVDFVRKFYPALVGALAPVIPPYIAQARLIRSVYPQGCAIVYVSPCYARKDEFRDPQFAGVIDAVIDFTELQRMFEGLGELPQVSEQLPGMGDRPGVLKELSLTDGFPRHTVESRDPTDASLRVVRGLGDLDHLLRAVMAGEAGPTIIDMLNCEGCLDGPAVNPGMSVFAKRNVDAAMRDRPGATHVSTKAMLAVLPSVETVRSFVAKPVKLAEPTDAELDEVLADGGITRQTALDCGACGWDTCSEHAAAVFRAESSWDLCLPLQRQMLAEQALLLDSQRSVIDNAQTLDALTGLWNRRVFAERLAIELARHDRYGDPVSVAIIDVDGMGGLNDGIGRPAGDAVLCGIAERIAQSTRATDVAARWLGDQFALILPGIGKTAAFVVGEKLRLAVADAPFALQVDGYTRDVTATISVGIATAANGPSDTHALLEAADAALHQAMAAGSDRVQLAPG
jgi:diguanylate cyclase (GGDEF)-like protein